MHQTQHASRRHFRMLGVSLCALVTWAATPLDRSLETLPDAILAPAPDAPVAEAAMRGDVAEVRALIARGEDVNAALGDGMTALHWSAERGDNELASLLLSAGAQTESTTRLGDYRPLHLAAKGGHESVVRELLQAGATSDPVTTTGDVTPLHMAAASGNAASVALLLEHGAEVDRRETAWGQTALMFAAASGRVETIRALLDGGATIDSHAEVLDMPTRDAEDREAQAAQRRATGGAERGGPQPPQDPQAAGSGRSGGRAGAGGGAPGGVDVFEAQRDRGPQALSQAQLVGGYGGLSALLLAVREGHSEAAMALLDAGSEIDQVSAGDHTTPLLMAVLNGHFDLAMQIFERGADATITSDAGATPLYLALNTQWIPKSRHPQPTHRLQQDVTYLDLMKAFLDAGVAVNAPLTKQLWFTTFGDDYLRVDRTGATPFWRAAYALDVEAMKLLVEYGADPNTPTVKSPSRRFSRGGGGGGGGSLDPSGLPPIEIGGPGTWPLQAASGVGYGEGFAANIHRHVPDAWLPAVRYLVEELGADVNSRDHNGYSAVHHAASRGDNELILYLVSKGADVSSVSRRGQTTVDMANGPVQRITPFPSTIALLEGLGAKNNHNCVGC
jgi:ankyrin repeat protein